MTGEIQIHSQSAETQSPIRALTRNRMDFPLLCQVLGLPNLRQTLDLVRHQPL